MTNYEERAKEFLNKHGARMKIDFIECAPYSPEDEEARNIYRFTIKRNGKQYSALFGDSISSTEAGETPSEYDILASLTKCEPYGDVWDFAEEYGYNITCREEYEQVKKAWNAVKREWRGVERLFGDCLDELAEIC